MTVPGKSKACIAPRALRTPASQAARLFAAGLRARFVVAPMTARAPEFVLFAAARHVGVFPRLQLRTFLSIDARRPVLHMLERIRETHRDQPGVIMLRHTRAERTTAQRVETQRVVERFLRVERLPAPSSPPTLAAPVSQPASPDRRLREPPPPVARTMVLHRVTTQPAVASPAAPSREPRRGFPPEPTPAVITQREIVRVADEVVSMLNRQSLAWRERFGRS